MTLEKSDMSPEKFKLLTSYAQSLTDLKTYVLQYQRRNNAILNSIARTGHNLGARGVTVTALKRSDYAQAYDKIDQRVRYWKKRDSDFSNEVRKIASAVGVKSPDLGERAYADGLASVSKGVYDVKQERDKLIGELTKANRKIDSLNEALGARDGEIKSLKAACADRDREIIRLRKVLGLEIPRSPIDDGSKEALEMVRSQEKGRIIDVDDKFGFYVCSLGKNTRVQEQFGNKVNDVNPMLPENTILTIARNVGDGNPVLIVGKARLVKLDANCSILEPIGENNERPRVGDLVYVADDEILNILKKRK